MTSTIEPSKKDIWDKMHASAALVASILGPVAVAFVGSAYSNAMKDSENKLRYVEIALSILRAEPDKSAPALREWAAEVLSKQSVVPLSPAAKLQLQGTRISGYFFLEPLNRDPIVRDPFAHGMRIAPIPNAAPREGNSYSFDPPVIQKRDKSESAERK